MIDEKKDDVSVNFDGESYIEYVKYLDARRDERMKKNYAKLERYKWNYIFYGLVAGLFFLVIWLFNAIMPKQTYISYRVILFGIPTTSVFIEVIVLLLAIGFLIHGFTIVRCK